MMQSHNVIYSCPELLNSTVLFFQHLHLKALLLLLAMI